MYLNPTRNLESELILLGHLSETEFDATRSELKQRISVLQAQYEQYAKDLTDRLEFIKNEIEPSARATVFVKSDMQLLMDALSAINVMLFNIRVTGIHLPDSSFDNPALKKVGLKYTSVYGDTSESAYAQLRGKHEVFTDPDKILEKLHFAVKYSDYALPYVDDSYTRDCLYVYHDNDDHKYYPLAIDYSQPLNRLFHVIPVDAMDTLHPVNAYDPANTNFVYYFKVGEEYRSADIRTVHEPYIPSEGFMFLTRTYGQLYQTDKFYTIRVHACMPTGTIFDDGKYEYVEKIVEMSFVDNTVVGHLAIGSEADEMDPETNEGFAEFEHQGRYIPIYSDTFYAKYVRKEGNTFVDISDEVTDDESLNTARSKYGTVYIRVPKFGGGLNVKLSRASQIIFNELDFDNPEIDNIKCLCCGNQHVGHVWTDPDHTWLDIVCSECGNHDATFMDIPSVLYTNRIHPYAFYDPDFSWIEFIIKETSLDYDLSLNRLWRGWWGTGIGCWSADLESLLVTDTLGNHGWDKSTYQLTSDLLLRILRWDLDNKVNIDELFTLMIDRDQAKALFQIANLWAVRHELIRLITTQIYKIYKKGVIYHA